jgi:isoleucyl-tRNA synthetase
MLLPRTSFPLHVPGIAAHERALAASHCGPRLYDWQSVARASLPRERTFILHDGPPFANGKLHMGHFLNKVLKVSLKQEQQQRIRTLQVLRLMFGAPFAVR